MTRSVCLVCLLLFSLYKLGVSQQSNVVRLEYEFRNSTYDFREVTYATADSAISVLESRFIAANKAGAAADKSAVSTIVISPRTEDRYTPEQIVLKTMHDSDIYQKLTYDDKEYLLHDRMPDMPWEVVAEDTKEIGGYTCIRATLKFRGYQVVAYFTPEIPIPFGPWKFKGLPGLIMEVQSIGGINSFHWVIKEIQYPYQDQVAFEIAENGDLVELSQQAFIEIVDRHAAIRKRRQFARTPANVQITNFKSFRPSLEQKYEWED